LTTPATTINANSSGDEFNNDEVDGNDQIAAVEQPTHSSRFWLNRDQLKFSLLTLHVSTRSYYVFCFQVSQ
jgi:hypothetical protein